MEGHFEAIKCGLRQSKDGVVISFVIHPDNLDSALISAPIGTILMVGFSSVGGDNGEKRPIHPAPEKKRERTPFSSLPLSQQAGIRATDLKFQLFLSEKYPIESKNCLDAAGFIRKWCGLESRSHLDIKTNFLAREYWLNLESLFQAYLTDQAYAGQIK